MRIDPTNGAPGAPRRRPDDGRPRGSPPTETVHGPATSRLAGLAALAALALAPLPLDAQGGETPSLSFDAFGTLGAVYSTEDEADFAWNITRPDGPGHSQAISPEVDTRLGGQLTASITPELTAVVQVVTEQTHDEDWDPHVEWANVRYAFTPDFSVRAGRMALPAFMVSEYRKVSYANPWIRPPVEVYGMVPVFSVDGVQATYRFHAGDWTTTLLGSFGRSESEFPFPDEDGEATATSENAVNLSATVQRGGLTGRVAVARGELDMDVFDPFFDAFRRFGPEGEAIADRYEVDDTPFEFATAGAEYDTGAWFGMAELVWGDFNSALGEKLAGYATGGRRFGPVTAYATYSRVEALHDTSVPGLPLAGLPPGAAATAAGLNAGLNGFLQMTTIQQNVAAGGRWDVLRGVALKLQVDFIDMLESSPGTFVNRQPGFEPGGSAQLVSLATTFVF